MIYEIWIGDEGTESVFSVRNLNSDRGSVIQSRDRATPRTGRRWRWTCATSQCLALG
jgi:hypothetical protein